jgi:hypothetical protein
VRLRNRPRHRRDPADRRLDRLRESELLWDVLLTTTGLALLGLGLLTGDFATFVVL